MNKQPAFRTLVNLIALALLATPAAQAFVGYWPGWFIDEWVVVNGPPNTNFDVQLHHYRCSWRTVASGTTNSGGCAEGWLIHWGPGDGHQPTDTAARAVFAGGGSQGGRFYSAWGSVNANVNCTFAQYAVGVAAVSGGHSITVTQNVSNPIVPPADHCWLRDGTWFSLRLPEHFTFAELPQVLPIGGGDLVIGPPILEDGGRMLSIPIVSNARLDPFSGIEVLDASIAYDGVAIPSYYWPQITGSLDRTPVGEPFNVIEQADAVGHYRGIQVHPDPWLSWFDETGGGGGYAGFPDLLDAYESWLGEPDHAVGFEGFPLGTKITDQYEDLSIWFTGTDGGNYNNLTGVQQEGDPTLVQDLTGYDGSYQPDGSLIYARFQNTTQNPDAPLMFTFDTLQRRVGGFIACGVDGDDHSFTVTVYDDLGQEIGSRVYTAELWEPDPTGQNYETFFAVQAPFAYIRSVSVLNNSIVEFADALIIDNIAWATGPATTLGDFDLDGDVDWADFAEYPGCMSGPGGQPGFTPPSSECLTAFDPDGDADVDLVDFAAFQTAFTGPLFTHAPFVPSPGQSDGEKTGTVGTVCHNIYSHSGEFTEQRRLLSLWGRAGLHWDLTITYRSGVIYDGPLGAGWVLNQDVWLRELPYSNDIVLHDGYGRADVYTYAGPEQPYLSPPGSYDVLEDDPVGGYMLTDRHGLVRRFDQRGLLESITHRTGNQILYEYDAVWGRLLRVTDALGREVLFDWDHVAGRLTSVDDPEGRTVTFGYDAEGRLETVTLPPTPDQPAGSTTTYTCSSGYTDPRLNGNLLTIEDARGQVYVENVYDSQDRVESQRFGPPASISQLEYSPGMTIVTDQDGYVVDYEYDSRGLMYRTTTHTHGVNPGNPPTYVWEQTHNDSTELTGTTLPRGNSIEYVFDELNPDRLARGNLLEVRNISHIPSEPTLTISYTYEPRYNMPKSTTDARGQMITCYYDYEEATLGDLNGDGITTQDAGNTVLIEHPTATLGQPAPQTIAERFWYDDQGNCIRQIEPDGEVILYELWTSGPGQGMLRSITRDYGGLNLTTEYGYNARGDVLWKTDPLGSTVTYDVNNLGQVITETKPAPFNYQTVYHYDANGNLVSEEVQNVDENGVPDPDMPWIVTEYQYDILNNMTAKTEQVSETHTVTTTYVHDVDGNLLSKTRPEGNVETWVYDERDQVYQHTRGHGSPDEATDTFTYDGNRNLIERVSAEGIVYGYSYDGCDRRTGYVNPEGVQVETQYEGLRLKSSTTCRDATNTILSQREFSYDEAGRLYREDVLHLDSPGAPVGDGVSTTTWRRDPSGRTLVKTFDDGSTLVSTYDGAGRLTEVSQPLSGGHENRTANELDAWGNVLTETRYLYNESTGADDVFVNRHEYDELTRLTREERGAGGEEYTEYQYNSRNLETLYSNAVGTVTRTIYDGLDREIEKRCEAPITHGIRRVVWNDNSLPVEQYDANENVTTHEYDALDRLTAVAYADGTQRGWAYDRDSRLVTLYSPTGTVEHITPNFAGYPEEIDINPGPGVGGATHISYQYDGLNRLTWGQTLEGGYPTTTSEWHFDTMSNLDRELQWTQGMPASVEIASSYDGCGNRTSLLYPGGMPLEYTADEAHRLKEIRSGPETLASLDYVGRRLSGRQYLNGAVLDAAYDERFRTSFMSHAIPGGPDAGFEYAYDEVGRKKYEQRLHDMKGDAYHYDEMDELLGAKYGVPDLDPTRPYESYTIFDSYSELTADAQQNRMTEDANGTLIQYNSPSGPYQPDLLNRYYWIQGVSRTYDSSGNLTYNGALSLVYNSQNRIVSAEPGGVTYLYDCHGRRARASYADGTMVFLLYDREHCIEERDGLGATVATYVWGQELDDLLMMERGGSRCFCHENDLGSICLVTDMAGAPVEKIVYDAYGKPSFFVWNPGGGTWDPAPQSVVGLPYLFTGQRYDDHIGLYTGRNRTYDPDTGRYLQFDGEQGSWEQYLNRYSYGDSSNDYVNVVSPYGTGGPIDTHSWTSGIGHATDPYYEHICYLSDGDTTQTENSFSLFKFPFIEVRQERSDASGCRYGQAGLSGNNCNGSQGIQIRVYRNGNTVEMYIFFHFTITVNTSKVCTWYTERDPQIVQKRNRQDRPVRVHITKGFIQAHEFIHILQMMDKFQETVLAAIQRYNPKSKCFPRQVRKRLKEAYQDFKRDVHRGYPFSQPERDARQGALEAWDRNKWKWMLQWSTSLPD